jgi:predicted RNA binding protein YcfA (HicA-like mRNA interferase family)
MPRLPGVNHEQAVRAFEKAGFWIARQGKHVTMADGERVITIPGLIPSVPSLWPEL